MQERVEHIERLEQELKVKTGDVEQLRQEKQSKAEETIKAQRVRRNDLTADPSSICWI